MEQEQKKSPVDIVQKLIAIHTTRKEAGEKMLKQSTASQDLQNELKTVISQSDRFSKTLLNELSQFGDAVTSEVSRDDEYHTLYNKKTSDIDTMNVASLTDTFKQLERKLIDTYNQIAETYQDLPASVNDLLHAQINELKQTPK